MSDSGADLDDAKAAGAANPGGYDAMLWFFGALRVIALVAAALPAVRGAGRAPA